MTFQRLPRPVYACQCGDHVWVALTKGYVTLASPQDLGILSSRAWTLIGHPTKKTLYARSTFLRLHREIMQAPDGVLVDHISGNGLDNRRPNLRLASHSQNGANWGAHRHSTSKFRGVCWYGKKEKWIAQICVKYRHISLGEFNTEIDAAHAYDKAARMYFGDFARPNFP